MNRIENQRKAEKLSFGKELLTFSIYVSCFGFKGMFLVFIMPVSGYCLSSIVYDLSRS